MRLGIVSDCIHYQHPDGRIGTENHILLQQIEALASHFKAVIICCPVANYSDSLVLSFYMYQPISFAPVKNVGGNSLKAKIKVIKNIPDWVSAFKKVHANADIVYQRFPNNLNIPGFFYFMFKSKKVFATYTGTWENYKNEPLTYRLQKWLLLKKFKGPFWAYTQNTALKDRMHAGFSPSYSKIIWDEEINQVEERFKKLQKTPLKILKLITVGAFSVNKNQQLILETCVGLKKRNIPFTLTLVGDGILKNQYENYVKKNELSDVVFFAGKKTISELRSLYRDNDFVVQAPIREGFGKVPIEGFFHGLIPVLSDVAAAKFITDFGKRGFTFKNGKASDLEETLANIYLHQEKLGSIILEGRTFAATQTLEIWAAGYLKVLKQFYPNSFK